MKKFSPKTNNVFGDEKIVDKAKVRGKISHGDIEYLPMEYIIPGRYQVRENFSEQSLEELKTSIIQHGILQPITVRKIDNQKYELISGERRWRAAKLVGMTHIPAIVSYFTDESALALGIIENIQRENLNVIEEANGYKKLIDEFGYTHSQISESVGKSRAHITNLLRVLTLSKYIQQAILAEEISLGHAKVLLSVPEDKREAYLQHIKDKQMSVRGAEKHRDMILNSGYTTDNKFKSSNNYSLGLDASQMAVVYKLKTILQRHITLKPTGYGQYKLECVFNSFEDFLSFIDGLNIEELAD